MKRIRVLRALHMFGIALIASMTFGSLASAAPRTPVPSLAGAVPSGFVDVPPGAPFFTEIDWLRAAGITTGSVNTDGTVSFQPAAPVSRAAMAAFLYRFAGFPAFVAPASSPFVDVATTDLFYKEIAWLAAKGISTGTDVGGGNREFRSANAVSRAAMAAFLYRFAGSPAFVAPPSSPFVDVATGGTFYLEISWLASTGISTGTDMGNGTWEFRPGGAVSRQAMAAFLYRARPFAPPVTLELASTPIPTISGTAATSSTLTANAGVWAPPGVTLSYQWNADGAAIPGATAATYAVTGNEVGKTLTVTVTGTKPGYTTVSKSSSPTSVVPAPSPQGVAAVRTQRMSDATLNSTQNGWYEAGSTLTLVCYRVGQSVQGYFSPYVGNGGWDSMWYQVSDGYFVADIDLETGTLEPVVARCAGSSPSSSTNSTVMATTQRMSDATLNSTQNGTYGAGARLTLTCYKRGQAVKGYYSPYLPNGGYDDLWYKVDDGYFVADVDIDTGSNEPVTPACSPPPASNGNAILTRAQSWIDAGVPYNQGLYFSNQYGTYRQDCSGFVSMALGLSSSYVTGTLPQVLHRISKDDLQPGDFMLNTASGNYGHTAIFVRWTDAAHTHYVSWEENGMAGRTIEQVVPYPYWPSWAGSSSYFPYRKS